MTNKQAKEIMLKLKEEITNDFDVLEDEEKEAFNKAIKALQEPTDEWKAGYDRAWEEAEVFYEQEPCDDVVSREAVLGNLCNSCTNIGCEFQSGIVRTKCAFYMPPHIESDNCGNYVVMPPVRPQEPKTGHCKDCKWWKDSDGLYRRGGHAESQCPINRREVLEGNGYCYMFEPQESEEQTE